MREVQLYTPGRCASRRDFLRWGMGATSFIVPLFRNGSLGQPVLAPGPWFVDVAQQAGLSASRDTSGSEAKDYLVETVGNGVAIFDYNNDGRLDVLFVNGSSFELLDNPKLPRTSSRLFRNNGPRKSLPPPSVTSRTSLRLAITTATRS